MKICSALLQNVEKEEPEIAALTFYYQFGSDQELAQLPPAEKLSKIAAYLYECEFRRPIAAFGIWYFWRARQQKRTYETATDRGSRKKYETLRSLDGQPEHILEQMMEE